MNTKQELRNHWLEKRSKLSEPQKNNYSHQIQDFLFAEIPIQKAEQVHVFLPVLEKGEVRTWSTIQYIFEKFEQVNVCAPRISDVKNSILESVAIERHTSYTKNKWGIDEPETGAIIQPETIDIILIPLIIFDTKGHRLGYGGGFYDRYLPKCTNATKIGLSFFEPIDQIPELNEHDIPMDFCVTPERVYRFYENKSKISDLSSCL